MALTLATPQNTHHRWERLRSRIHTLAPHLDALAAALVSQIARWSYDLIAG